MKAFWWNTNNLGDRLTPVIVAFFTGQIPFLVGSKKKGKLLAIGSLMAHIKENDVVWGTGSIRDAPMPQLRQATILALRGPLTRQCLRQRNKHLKVPEIYGDPAILTPLIYRPKIEKKYSIGEIPHYIDKPEFQNGKIEPKGFFINIEAPWKEVIDKILSCRQIISSSLHGIIIAEAYGIPAIWTSYSNNIIGGEFKFQDYFLGTGRVCQLKNQKIPPIENLENRQKLLLEPLINFYGNRNRKT